MTILGSSFDNFQLLWVCARSIVGSALLFSNKIQPIGFRNQLIWEITEDAKRYTGVYATGISEEVASLSRGWFSSVHDSQGFGGFGVFSFACTDLADCASF